jgi:hypothetical protein
LYTIETPIWISQVVCLRRIGLIAECEQKKHEKRNLPLTDWVVSGIEKEDGIVVNNVFRKGT